MGMQRYVHGRFAMAKNLKGEYVLYADAQERERVLREALEVLKLDFEAYLKPLADTLPFSVSARILLIDAALAQ